MYKSLLICLLFFIKQYNCYVFKPTGIVLSPENSKYNKFPKDRYGFDERYDKNNIDELVLLEKIKINHYKHKLLTELKRDDVNENDKIKLIEKHFGLNEIKPFNIINGGLLDEFNFDFDSDIN